MRIVILALGTRGDVQPYIALGAGFRAAGHAVRLVSHEDYEALITSHDLEYWSVRGNVQNFAESEEMRLLLEKGNFIAITRRTAAEARRAAVQWAEDSFYACQDADLIIAGLGGLYIGIALAEKLSIPFLQAYLVPFTPTSAFPGVLLPQSLSRLGGMFNRISHELVRQIMWQSYRSADSASRRTLNLPMAPIRGPLGGDSIKRQPILYGFSPLVVPKPVDWGEDKHVTGFWYLNSSVMWTPPDELVRFLEDGPPPVYIGFGSMSTRNPEETANMVIRALVQTRQRAVLLSGWSGLRSSDLPETVLMIDTVPHDWLFPQVSAVVHHGGAGTTAAGLRAGVPAIVIPFFGDQPFWGHRLARIGVGPQPIPRKSLTADILAGALREVDNNRPLRERAARLGEAIRKEDGVQRAIVEVESLYTMSSNKTI